MTATHTTEEQAVNLVRNALLVAGHEMGKDGDHWPVIKATAFSIMKDYEDWSRSNKMCLRKSNSIISDLIVEMQGICNECARIKKTAKYNPPLRIASKFTALVSRRSTKIVFMLISKTLPAHMKRAETIIETLEDDNAE